MNRTRVVSIEEPFEGCGIAGNHRLHKPAAEFFQLG
jgi:hypothetical protein